MSIDILPHAGLNNPLDRAARAFAGRAALEDAWPAHQSDAQAQVPYEANGQRIRIGVGDIVQWLADPAYVLSLDTYRHIQATPNLADAWRTLKTELAVATVPARIAAATGALATRPFSNGLIKVVPASTAGEVYVMIRWQPEAHLVPRTLLLEQEGVTLVKRELPRLRNDNEFVIICVSGRGEDTDFLRLIGDPRTTGVFIP